jgi:PAS domain S-box-containing protein
VLRKLIHNSTKSGRGAKANPALGHPPGLQVDLNTNSEAHRILNAAEALEIRQRQVDQVAQGVPLHVFFLLCSAITIAVTAHDGLSLAARIVWSAFSLIPILAYAFAWWIARQNRNNEKLVRIFEAAAFVQGIIWTVPLGFFLEGAPGPTQTIIIGVSLAVAGVGALALARVPVAAIVLSGLTIGAASRAVYMYIDNSSLAPSLLCATYGFVLVGIVVSMHWEFLRGTRAELEVARQRQVIALLLNDFEKGTSDWLWETDRDGKLSYFSPRFTEAIGRADADILGSTFEALIRPDSESNGWASFISAMSKQEEIPSLVLSLTVKAQRQHWQMTARPLFSDDNRFIGYRGVGRDVSERWQAEQAIRSAKETAEQANLAKSQFLSIVGHEIRTPLNAIVGFAELLMSPQSDVMDEKAKRNFLMTITESAHQLQSLINDVLDTTRIEKGTLRLLEQEIDAAEVVEVAAKQCRDQADHASVTVIVRVMDQVSILGDQSRLKQVMYNLLSNAIKFSPTGGVVNAEFERGPANEFVFVVRDAGIGIKSEDIERVFDPFVQADEGTARRYGGLGLGLALARRIARLHGGEITLTSSRAMGTVARLTLPAARISWPRALAKQGHVAA